jgi:predicted nucleic-acid-binding Zn-ribbon protein
MKTKLRMKCKQCGHWNSIEVEKVMLNPDSPEPKVQIFIPHYLPLKEEKCSKCGAVIAEEKELIRIVHKF